MIERNEKADTLGQRFLSAGRTSAIALLTTTMLTIPMMGTANAADLEEIQAPVVEENDPLTLFDGRLKIGLGAAQHFNALQTDNNSTFFNIDAGTDPSFQRLRFNLELTFHITDNVFAFVDIAEEPNDFQGLDAFSLNQDFGFIDLNLTGLAGIESGPEVHFKTGNIGVGTFDGLHSFSDGSVVQGNPLIGNSPTSFGTAQSGAQLVISDQLDGFIKSYSGDIAVTVPTFGGDSNPEKGFNLLTGFGVDTNVGLSFSTRFFLGGGGGQVGQGQSTAIAGTPGAFSLNGVQTDGLFAGDGDNYFLASNNRFGGNGGTVGNGSAGGNGDGRSSRIFHQNLLPGIDAHILQFNAQYRSDFGPGTLIRAWGGFAESDFRFVDANGNQVSGGNPAGVGVTRQESSISFFGVGVQQFLLKDKLYLAGRFTQVNNTTDGVANRGTLRRYQVGGGFFIDERSLIKVEYVNQDEEIGSAGQTGGFDGVVSELSVRF
ncbi:MAG: hypothetical protein ABJK39_07040 [Hyphomicrobiales bacterium]